MQLLKLRNFLKTRIRSIKYQFTIKKIGLIFFRKIVSICFFVLYHEKHDWLQFFYKADFDSRISQLISF